MISQQNRIELVTRPGIEKGIRMRETALWMLNAFIWGIFAIWPLAFQDFYLANEEAWCSLPLAIC